MTAPPPRRAPTREDVARLAGVSVAVVSYTLNGGPKPVAAATAQRVRDAVAKLGYTPNAAARALRRGSSDVLGLVVPDIANPYYGRMARAVADAAARRGCDVIVSSTSGSAGSSLEHLRNLHARQVSGILVAVTVPFEGLAEVARMDTPIVQIDGRVDLPGATRILADLRGGVHHALEHLFALGHDSVAFLGDADPADARRAAWLELHRITGRTPGPFEAAPYTRAGGRDGMLRMLALAAPTAVLAASDMIAIGALRALRDAGMRVPDDVSLVGIDDTEEAEFAGLTTVRQPVEAMAVDAVEALLDRPRVPSTRDFDVLLVERDSAGPPRA